MKAPVPHPGIEHAVIRTGRPLAEQQLDHGVDGLGRCRNESLHNESIVHDEADGAAYSCGQGSEPVSVSSWQVSREAWVEQGSQMPHQRPAALCIGLASELTL